MADNPTATAAALACDCPNDGRHCPHCGREADTAHRSRCHRAAIGGWDG